MSLPGTRTIKFVQLEIRDKGKTNKSKADECFPTKKLQIPKHITTVHEFMKWLKNKFDTKFTKLSREEKRKAIFRFYDQNKRLCQTDNIMSDAMILSTMFYRMTFLRDLHFETKMDQSLFNIHRFITNLQVNYEFLFPGQKRQELAISSSSLSTIASSTMKRTAEAIALTSYDDPQQSPPKKQKTIGDITDEELEDFLNSGILPI